jgi:hypothetical protein
MCCGVFLSDNERRRNHLVLALGEKVNAAFFGLCGFNHF